MRSICKKLVTDINREANIENDILEYSKILSSEYSFYAIVKICMNYYTMKEMIDDYADKESDVVKYYTSLTDIIKKYLIKGTKIDKRAVEAISALRGSIENKMMHLTSYTDAYEIYEYILNRIEAKVNGEYDEVDIDKMVEDLFKYIFSDNDTVVINSKLQLVLSQLPIRMTKNKFYDILTNTLTIYKGGETSAVDNFVDMLRTTALIKKPENFENEYPQMYALYDKMRLTDYANISKADYDTLCDEFSSAASVIEKDASCYILMQEIVNDVYTVILTYSKADLDTIVDKTLLDKSIGIISECIASNSVDDLDENVLFSFASLEGVQESVYEKITILETIFDDIVATHMDIIKKNKLASKFEGMQKAGKLLSTSLFMALEEETVSNEEADNDYIMKLRDEIVDDFKAIFADNNRMVNRSIMSKVIAGMPIFLNNQQEIKDYFTYVLENCKDDSELTACSRLIYQLMDEE